MGPFRQLSRYFNWSSVREKLGMKVSRKYATSGSSYASSAAWVWAAASRNSLFPAFNSSTHLM